MTPADMFVGRVKRLVAEEDDQGLVKFFEGICEGARGTEQPTLRAAILEKREPLVQEVIAAIGDTSDGFQLRLIRSLKALVEWKP